MRKLCLIVIVFAVVFLLAPSSMAQYVHGMAPAGIVKVDVPFDFMVSDTHLNAGTYMFSIDTATSRLYIRNVATGETVSVLTGDIISNDQPTADKLVFRQDGQQHVLHRVWSTQADHVHDIVHGTAVKEL